MAEKPFIGPEGPEESHGFYLIPRRLVDDLTIESSAIRLYAIIKDRTTAEHEVPNTELIKATGLTKAWIIQHKSKLADRGLLKRKFDQHGQRYYSAIHNKQDIQDEIDDFLSVSLIFKSILNSKNFFLIKRSTDPDLFLLSMEVMELEKQRDPAKIRNVYAHLRWYINQIRSGKLNISKIKGFKRGWWKIRLEQLKEAKRAKQASKNRALEDVREKELLKELDKRLASDKAYKKSLEERVEDAFRQNGGKRHFVNDHVKRSKMIEFFMEDLKNEAHRGRRNERKEV